MRRSMIDSIQLKALEQHTEVNDAGESATVTSPPPPPKGAEEALLQRVLAQRPQLAKAFPPGCKTAPGKLAYLIAHKELTKDIPVPLSVRFGAGGALSQSANGGLELTGGPGTQAMRLNDQHGDLARLLDGAQQRGEPSFDNVSSTSRDTFLQRAISAYSSDPRFDSGAVPENTRGENTFFYSRVDQVLVTDDTTQRGFECVAAADFNMYKSMGLVPPDLNRQEVEHRYTSIHGDAKGATVRVGQEFNSALRGIPSSKPFTSAEVVKFANALRADDWAKLSGASSGTYQYKALPTIGAVVSHFAEGGGAVHASWADRGHHFVISQARPVADGDVQVSQDDSLFTKQPRALNNQWPNRNTYDPSIHSAFWTMVRER